MRARVIAGGAVSSAAILVIGWQLGAAPAVTAGIAPGATEGTTGSSSTPSSSSSSPSSSPSSSGGSTTTTTVSGTFDGTTSETRYGPVQVEIVVAEGRITDVKALQLTDQDGRSVAISNQAAPILRQEALQAQSANIQSVSGATYTSEGYTTSLQSAIDKAGL